MTNLLERSSRVVLGPYFLPATVVLFVLVRLALIHLVPIEMFSDAAWYLGRGEDIANGLGYSENGVPTAFWPVGYPGFLGLLFYIFEPTLLVGQYANLVLSVLSLLLVYLLARKLTRYEYAARLSVLLLALYPNYAAYTSVTLSEIYFTFLLLLGVYLFITLRGGWRILGVGIVFGLAALTKPQFVFIPALLTSMLMLERPRAVGFRQAAVTGILIYAIMAAVLVPWAVRNTLIFGEVILISTNGGVTLLSGNNPSARGLLNERDPLVQSRGFSVADQVASDQRARALALEWIRNNPERFLQLMPLKAFHLWYMDGEGEWGYQAGFKNYESTAWMFRLMRVANQLFYFGILLAALLCLGLFVKQRGSLFIPYFAFGYVFAIYMTLIAMVFSGQSRFHFPAMPWLIIYAACTLTWLVQRLSKEGLAATRPSVEHASVPSSSPRTREQSNL
jgi:hypothetical protein